MSKIKSKFNGFINELKENPEETQQKEKTGTALLDSLGRDLTALAKESKSIQQLAKMKWDEVIAICRRRKNNPVLIKYPCSKTAIVEALLKLRQ
ncbi:MAG: hypothetical protein LC127_03995 [Chitinophagales bacterium]|nr:hypothetical protein [Chitinophagales bacterium]